MDTSPTGSAGALAPNAVARAVLQIDHSPWSDDAPSPALDEAIPIPPVDTYINLKLLGRHGPSNDRLPGQPASRPFATGITDTKRKASPSLEQASKRPKTEHTDEEDVAAAEELDRCNRIFSTTCLFRINEGHESSDTNGVFRDLGRVVLSENHLAFHDFPEDGLLFAGAGLNVCLPTFAGAENTATNTLAVLPLINTTSPLFTPEHGCWRSTNGQWLLQAVRLSTCSDLLSLDARASYNHSDGCLRLEIAGFLRPAAFIGGTAEKSPTHRERPRLLQLMDLMRFASVSSTIEAEHQRRRGLDASALYSNIFPPPVLQLDLQPEGLEATLLPFQRNSVAFILRREGKSIVKEDPDAPADAKSRTDVLELGLGWEQVSEGLYYNPFIGAFARRLEDTIRSTDKGALVAEEMGLGKTVEVLAVTLLNPAPADYLSRLPYIDSANEVTVHYVKTTLIVTPDLLRKQWSDEIQRHAPDLRVYYFEGHIKAAKDVPAGKTWAEFAEGFDVILVTFVTLQREVGVALKERPRSRRAPRKYDRPRCPLIQLHFWRVVCDEVQMVSNTTQAGYVVSLIPRESSLAVSGTPFKKADDLYSLFTFLRLDLSSALPRTPTPSDLAPHLYRALNRVATRHLKTGVAAQLALPPQHRFVFPIDFTAIEGAYYETVWTNALRGLGLDAHGAPLSPEWELDQVRMRQQLLLLRQACTHPQVAGRVLGSGHMAQGNLRSMAEVLQFMQEQTKSQLFKERTTMIGRTIDRAVLRLQSEDASNDYVTAQATLEYAVSRVQEFCDEEMAEITACRKTGPGYRFTTAEVMAQGLDDGRVTDYDAGSGDARREARAFHLSALRNRHRIYLEQLARANHWLGNLFFRQGEILSEEQAKEVVKAREDAAYQAAEKNRNDLLAATRDAVERFVLSTKQAEIKFSRVEIQLDPAPFDFAGIRTYAWFQHINDRIQRLNASADVLFSWRKQIVDLLYQPINREVSEDDPDDDQYAEALEAQHSVEVLLEMYRPLLARRQEIITNQVAFASTDMPASMKALQSAVRVAQQRKRQATLRGDLPSSDATGEESGILAESDKLKLQHYKKLKTQMFEVSLPDLDSHPTAESYHKRYSLAQLLGELRSIVDDEVYSKREIERAKSGAQALRPILKRQQAFLDAMRREMDAFARLFNHRAEYFKQLQALSDALADLDVPKNALSRELAKAQTEIDAAATNVKQQESRIRYLDHLAKVDAQDVDEEHRRCIICTDIINVGVLLSVCNHTVCQKCFHEWYRTHRTCPICRAVVSGPDKYHRIVYRRPREVEAPATTPSAGEASQSASSSPRQTVAYNSIEPQLRDAIEAETSSGGVGSKIDTLVKHLLYIESETPGDKTIVFSAFPRGLELVSDALRRNGLRFTVAATGRSGAASIQRYVSDDVNILLLSSETTSAGLNLMVTKNIIMLEPLVNSGKERQALGRIHRIGQTKATNVYAYYVRESVEDRIMDMAAAKGQSLYLLDRRSRQEQQRDSGMVIAETTGAKNNERGDYVNSVDDLLSCFFAEHIGGSVPTAPNQSL